jgi:hypothetical protein
MTSVLTNRRPPALLGVTCTIWLSAALAAGAPATPDGAEIAGEQKVWHAVTLTFDGPEADEHGSPNPFLDFRLSVVFSNGVGSFAVPGYFAADGDAGETGAAAGRKWRVHFVPDAAGEWRYTAFFRAGEGVALSPNPDAGAPAAPDGVAGSFVIAASDKSGRDHRGKGMLRHVGERYLRFAGTGEAFLKGGADSPENFLAYAEFDGTPDRHRYEPHVADWRQGDPTWRGGRGRGIIGAVNYLASRGMNSIYFLTMNVGGDGKDVWPWTGPEERLRYDVSKLAQWDVVFSHMDREGILLHVVQQETENDQLLDSGELGTERRLYYRELVARFGHHLALVWNLGEENSNSREQRIAFAEYLRGLDPYDHPIVLHTMWNRKERLRHLTPLLGFRSLDGPSLQIGRVQETHDATLHWVKASERAGHPWFVSLDEIGPADRGVLRDDRDPEHDTERVHGLWGHLMAGGAGVEWYLGSTEFISGEGAPVRHWWDLETEDWRAHERMWDQTRHALEFFRRYLPFDEMSPDDFLATRDTAYCLARPGEVYAVYLPSGGSSSLDLGASTVRYRIDWYDPRNGGPLRQGSIAAVEGPGVQPLGAPPTEPGRDWVVLVRRDD